MKILLNQKLTRMFKNFKISPDERKLFAKSNSSDYDINNLKGQVRNVIAVENKNLDNSPIQFMPFTSEKIFQISDFNKSGEMLLYREVYEGNIPFMKNEYIYDLNGKLLEELIYDEDDNIIDSVIFKHNIQGQMIEEFRKNYDIRLLAFYDENGYLNKVKEESELQGYGEKFYIIKRENENISEIEIIEDNKLTNKSFYKYDDFGNVRKVEHYNGVGDLLSSELIEYDVENNMLKLTVENKRRATVYSYDYNYDDFGNWINFKFYVNGEFNSETNRKIQYYQ